MTEEEVIDHISERMAEEWEKFDVKMAEFISTLEGTPTLALIAMLISKAADIAFEEGGWDEETFMKLVSICCANSKGTLGDRDSIH